MFDLVILYIHRMTGLMINGKPGMSKAFEKRVVSLSPLNVVIEKIMPSSSQEIVLDRLSYTLKSDQRQKTVSVERDIHNRFLPSPRAIHSVVKAYMF